MPKVSVIVPVYNVEAYLPKCLDSLVNQTLDSYEVIVVNDGSPDNSQDIIDEYAEKYPDIIKPFIKENGGLSDARNFGIEKATGEYIAFVDSDDYVTEDMFEKLYVKATDTSSDIVVCGFNSVYLNNDLQIKKIKPKLIERAYAFGKSIFESPEILVFSKSYAPNKIYKRELFDHFKFPVGQLFEDSAVIYNVLSAANKVELVNEPLYQYVTARQGAITTKVDERIFDIFKSCDSIINHFKKIGRFEELKSEIEALCLRHIDVRYVLFRKKGSLRIQLKYVDKSFEYLNNHFPDWKNNKYYMQRRARALSAYPGGYFDRIRESRTKLKRYYVLLKIKKAPKSIKRRLLSLLGRIFPKFSPKTSAQGQVKRGLKPNELRELQLITVDVLKTVVDFCNKNKLRYYLAEGSLLGAVRHKGYIPWDDDLDIAMPREDYEKFLKLWGKTEHNNCKLYHQSTCEGYYLTFSKVLFTGKCRFISRLHQNLKVLKGVNDVGIDIFPLDESEKLSVDLCLRTRKIRELRNVLLLKVGYFRKKEQRKLYGLKSLFMSYKSLHNKLYKLYTLDAGKNTGYISNFASSYIISKENFPKEWFEPAREIMFEGIKVTIPAESEKILTCTYGDYMTPPPEENRVSPHKYIVKKKI